MSEIPEPLTDLKILHAMNNGDNNSESQPYSTASYAFIGDAVFSLWIRQQALQNNDNAVSQPASSEGLHQWAEARVKASHQAELLEKLLPELTEQEHQWVLQGRNLKLSKNKRRDYRAHRLASGFEVLMGALWCHNPQRLMTLLKTIPTIPE